MVQADVAERYNRSARTVRTYKVGRNEAIMNDKDAQLIGEQLLRIAAVESIGTGQDGEAKLIAFAKKLSALSSVQLMGGVFPEGFNNEESELWDSLSQLVELGDT